MPGEYCEPHRVPYLRVCADVRHQRNDPDNERHPERTIRRVSRSCQNAGAVATWAAYEHIVRRWRLILAQLPPEAARAIALNNAARLYGR
jgi:hypothetical protein